MRAGVLLALSAAAAGVALAPLRATAADDSVRIRLLASNCANCHGTDGRSQGGIPSLNGQAKTRIIEAMHDFRSGKRVATVMHQLAKGYNDAEIDLLAGYFAAQK